MWIISKKGLFNLDAISCIKEYPGETVAVCNGVRISIADQKICGKIVDALKNGTQFLEVE